MNGELSSTWREEEPFAVPVGEIFGRLRRQRRFLAAGLLTAGSLVAAVGLFVPRTFVAEATLALPQLATLDRKEADLKLRERAPMPGIPVHLYKRLDRTLREVGILRATFGPEMSGREIAALGVRMDRHVSPLTSTVRDELARIERDDSIVGLRLQMEAPSPEQAEARVTRLAALVRQRFVATVALDAIDADSLATRADALEPATEILERRDANRSLARMSADLEALGRRVAPVDGPRQVVSTADGGHFYLPPGLQRVGAEAAVAENDHSIRLLEQRVSNAEAKLAFQRRLARRIDDEQRSSPAGETDWSRLVLVEFEEASRSIAPGNAEYLRVEARNLADTLALLRSTTRWLDAPSVRRAPRLPAVLLALLAAAILVLITAYVRDAVSHG